MADKVINITYLADGDATGLKELAKSSEGVKNALKATVSEAEQLKGNVINFAALATGLKAAQESFSALSQGMQSLVADYTEAEIAEKKLETVMRQRMGASDEEIQSIKDLAKAQMEAGVIADEVQFAGAQQVATFINEKETLDSLIPAMNNLLAQQKGLNATTQDAVGIGNLMGKVMQGQTSALTRVGITFSEAEEKVLKYGTEQERAAMLAQVITNNVGEMNAALASTDSGQQKQLEDKLGEIKDSLAELVIGAQPFVTIASQALTAAVSIGTLVSGVKALSTTLWASAKAWAVSTAAVVKNKVATLAAATSQKVVAAATATWAGIQKVLNFILSANPIGIVVMAIGALVTAVVAAYNNCEGFRKICDQVWAALKPLATAIMDGLAKAFEWLVEKCKEAWEWLKNILGLGGKKVEVKVNVSKPKTPAPKMNLGETTDKYANYGVTTPTITPKVNTAGVEKVEEKVSNGLIGQLEKKISEARDRLRDATSESAIQAINAEIDGYESELDRLNNLGKEMGTAVAEGVEEGITATFDANATSLRGINTNIQLLQEQLQDASVNEAVGINAQIKAWQEKADAIRNAGKEAQKTGASTYESLTKGWGSIKSLAGGVESITEALTENGTAWEKIVAIIDGFITIYESIRSIIDIIQTLTGVTNMLTAAKQAEATASIANAGAKTTEASANTAAAVSGALSAHSSIPFVGIAMGLAAAAAIIATMLSIPKFATGGIVSGPTLAMVGEYGGASNNPEVIAPLNKLRGLLGNSGGGYEEVKFKIEGRTLVGILNKESNINKRS
jgi:hypothetical protein